MASLQSVAYSLCNCLQHSAQAGRHHPAAATVLAMATLDAGPSLDGFVSYVKDFVDEVAPEAKDGGGTPEVISWDINLVYGELTPRGMHSVLTACVQACTLLQAPPPPPPPGEPAGAPAGGAPPPRAFWDLGSGEGVPVLVSALCFPCFDKSVGVELVVKLHALACRHMDTTARVLDGSAPCLPAHPRPPVAPFACTGSEEGGALAPRVATVELVCGDFLVEDWTLAAVVFCNGTCYQDDVLTPLYKKAEKLRPGAIFCITSQTVVSPLFERVWEGVVPSSWGTATARAYRRKDLPRWMSSIRTGGAR